MSRAAKNPTCVAAQLRHMIRRRRRELLWIPLFWLIPLLGVLACWRFDAPSWMWALAIIALVSGVIEHLSLVNQLQDWKKRLQAMEDDEPRLS